MKISAKQSLIVMSTMALAIAISWWIIIPQIKITSIARSVNQIQEIPGFKGSTVVIDARYEGKKKSIIEINTDKLIHPGSNYKLLTAAASLYYLEPDFTFKTNFYTIQEKGKIHLVIEGRGDPTFHHEDIQVMAQTLAQKNIKITGNTYYDVSYFSGEAYGPDWKPEWQNQHFGVPISALQLDDNIMYIRGSGSTTKKNLMIQTAALSDYRPIVDKRTIVTTPGPYNIKAKMAENGSITLEGETSGNNDFSTSTNMHNPAQITAEVFKQELIQANIMSKKAKVINISDASSLYNDKTKALIYTYESAPLSKIVQRMLTFSKNNYGETLIRTIGEEIKISSSMNGSQAKGVELLKNFISKEVAISPDDFMGVDGSGMSPSSRITGRAIIQLFEYVNRQSWKNIYWAALPTSNNEGTLHYRFIGANIQDPIIAKTGTHEFASSLSGKILRSKDTILFSIHIFHHQIGNEHIGDQVNPVIDRIVQLLDERL